MNSTQQTNLQEFFAQQRLKPQVDRIIREHGSRELNELWPMLELKLPEFFDDLTEITPVLLHGDLWSGNVAETDEGPGCVTLTV